MTLKITLRKLQRKMPRPIRSDENYNLDVKVKSQNFQAAQQGRQWTIKKSKIKPHNWRNVNRKSFCLQHQLQEQTRLALSNVFSPKKLSFHSTVHTNLCGTRKETFSSFFAFLFSALNVLRRSNEELCRLLGVNVGVVSHDFGEVWLFVLRRQTTRWNTIITVENIQRIRDLPVTHHYCNVTHSLCVNSRLKAEKHKLSWHTHATLNDEKNCRNVVKLGHRSPIERINFYRWLRR